MTGALDNASREIIGVAAKVNPQVLNQVYHHLDQLKTEVLEQSDNTESGRDLVNYLAGIATQLDRVRTSLMQFKSQLEDHAQAVRR